MVRLMTKHGLSELDIQDGDRKVRLKREGKEGASSAVALPAQAAAPVVSAAPANPTPSAPPKNLIDIKSPTPGTFYSQEKPGTPPYVSKGTKVTPATIVCQIEAMKLFNEIPAECSGTIAEILVENKQPVEYGQILFRVDPNG
ncbi:MAG: acetyl-CoA carboxylase, biotin carboxyl carrier protein [Gemmataceae bacterium]|nr:acetyl-CoA carboxylase, biotin carboxyl carrier protein [Gemmataceae bacterium]